MLSVPSTPANFRISSQSYSSPVPAEPSALLTANLTTLETTATPLIQITEGSDNGDSDNQI